MSLTKQIFLYSVSTDSYYNEDERKIHNRLVKLYCARKNNKLDWKKKAYNRIIKKEKAKLSDMLDSKVDAPIVRELNPDTIHSRNVISLFESSLTRALEVKQNELTTDLFVVNVYFFQVFNNLVKNGFIYNGERYIFLTASAGQIRTKRAVFICESVYERIQPRLMCGLTWDDINNAGGINPNKFMAYLALNNSATDIWHEFDIDKAIVVDDFETAVPGLVDYIDSVEYNITRMQTDTVIPHSDGWGMMRSHKTRMVRAPWIKGLLVQFPFDEWITENCPNGSCVVVDIYGKEYKLPDDNIEFILTKSQFKLYKYYASWDEYKAKFKQYGCEACYCNIEEDDIPQARINYQMLQTLTDMKDTELNRIVSKSIDEITNIGLDYQTNMRLLGAVESNQNPSWFQQALMLYPELFRDSYSQDILKQTKKSLVKQAKAGRLRVNGKYLFLSPDPVAFCQWLFLGIQNPTGLLADGEVYCREFNDSDELACLRSPHLYREWAVRSNRRSGELDRWLGQTKCIYTSCHDLISRYLMFDNDGDKALVVKDRTLTNVAKRNMADIVPLAYDLKKAQGGMLTRESIYDGMVTSYAGGNIGPVSNNISKIWGNSDGVSSDELNAVKYLVYYNNAVIDQAKTLWLPQFPKEIKQLIKSYTRKGLPNYFKYAKDKTDEQVEGPNNSTMNRISAAITNPRLRFSKALGQCDYAMLINHDYGYGVNETDIVVQRYMYWIKHQYIFKFDSDAHVKQEDLYAYQQIRKAIIEESGADIQYIVNTLTRYLYVEKPTWTKKLLWGCFGAEIVENLKANTKQLGNICKICGKRYIPNSNRQLTCGDKCARINEKRTKAKLAVSK